MNVERLKARAGVAGVTLGAAGALVALMFATSDTVGTFTPEASRCGGAMVETPGGVCIPIGGNTQAGVAESVAYYWSGPGQRRAGAFEGTVGYMDRYPAADPNR